MSSTVISVENLSKVYRLGQIGTGTLTNDIKVWWARARGKPNPLLKIGQSDHGNVQGENLWALRDVSFKVEQGEVLGIIGRNGAGKSTLLKILSRVTAPTSGSVKVKGRIASLLEVGTGFHPELTGRENIYLNGAILGMTREEVRRKFDEIVDFAGIEDFIDTPVKRYSSGMYVRLAFAVAAHLESEILLVDEVLAVGDAEFQKKSLGKMGDVASKEGRTVLFVSHNMGAVKQLCSLGILLDSGKISSHDTILNVIDDYFITSTKESSLQSYLTIDRSVSTHIRTIQLLNSKKNPTDSFYMGEKIFIKLEIEGMNALHDPRIGISFNTFSGQRIFIFDTDMKSNLNEISFSSKDIAVLTIFKLPLLPGNYSLDFIIAERHGGRIDFIKDAIRFIVLPENVFNNSYLLSNAHGLIFHTNGSWEIMNEKT